MVSNISGSEMQHSASINNAAQKTKLTSSDFSNILKEALPTEEVNTGSDTTESKDTTEETPAEKLKAATSGYSICGSCGATFMGASVSICTRCGSDMTSDEIKNSTTEESSNTIESSTSNSTSGVSESAESAISTTDI